jgi:hypothetical protein
VLAVVVLAFGGYWIAGSAGARRRARLPACGMNNSPDPYMFARRSASGVVGVTSLGTWGTSRCRLHERVTFAVKRFRRTSPGATVGGIDGNPASRVVDLVLNPGSVIVASWEWRNWCRPQDRIQLAARWGESGFTWTPRLRAPACNSGHSASTLSAAPARLRRCSSHVYTFAAGLGQGLTGGLITPVQISLRPGHPPCVVRDLKVSFAIQRESGREWATVRQIKGNPGHRVIGAVLASGQPAQLFWDWTNWCGGGAGRFRALARIGGRIVTGPATRSSWAPVCGSSSYPSTLTPSYG